MKKRSSLAEEFIPDPVHGDDVLRLGGRLLDLLAEPRDVIINGAGEGIILVTPDLIKQLLAARSVDVIFLCDTYHHINDRVAYFAKVRQALKPGGAW